MTIEVALIQTDPNWGVKILGRCRDPELVEVVREQLVTELNTQEIPSSPLLRIVNPEPDRDSLESDGGHDDGDL